MARRADIDGADLRSMLSQRLGVELVRVERMPGGRNSRVYRLISGGAQFAAKFYFQSGRDERDRLQTEFGALRFLWDHGVTCVPRPLVADRELGCGVFQYVDGRSLPADEVREEEIDEAVAFLVRLRALVDVPTSRSLPAASEACFSLQAVVENIRGRLQRLAALPQSGRQDARLHAFLAEELDPACDEITTWSRTASAASGIRFGEELEPERRTLSPSDFGFHNALKQADGRLVFLDFEYFGWDDPSKTVSDFLLHPAMPLPARLRRRFVRGVLRAFSDPRLARRIEVAYPLFALKWCLILLNEFLPEQIQRHGFASGAELDGARLRAAQLAKARAMLQTTLGVYRSFPYAP